MFLFTKLCKPLIYFTTLVIFTQFVSTALGQNKSKSNSVVANASIATNYAEVYEGPNTKTPIAIISKFTPVKILSKASIYSKIRDAWGNDGWVKSEVLNPKDRYVITKAPLTQIIKTPGSNDVAFEVTGSVALQLIGTQGDWLKVKHFDQQMGFVQASSILGF